MKRCQWLIYCKRFLSLCTFNFTLMNSFWTSQIHQIQLCITDCQLINTVRSWTLSIQFCFCHRSIILSQLNQLIHTLLIFHCKLSCLPFWLVSHQIVLSVLRLQQVTNCFYMNFKARHEHRYWSWRSLKNHFHSTRNNTAFTSHHVRFTGACLSISKNTDIETI